MLKRINYTEDAATGLGTMPPLVPYEKHARFQFTVNQDRLPSMRPVRPSINLKNYLGNGPFADARLPFRAPFVPA